MNPLWLQPIHKSMLDEDLYKFTQQMAFLELFPNEQGCYKFKNRGKHRFTPEFMEALRFHVNVNMPKLAATQDELIKFKEKAPYLKPWYFEYLRNFRYNPSQVKMWLDKDNNLCLEVRGPLHEVMMWEVKLMSLISELYFLICDTKWTMDGQVEKANAKGKKLSDAGCIYTDFGTRRRRSYEVQDMFVRENMKYKGF